MALVTAIALVAPGCGGSGGTTASSRSAPTITTAPAAGFALRSPAFAAGARIPQRYTCDGPNSEPPLVVSHPPRGTRAFALTLEDPDAPGGTFTHLLAAGFPARSGPLGQPSASGRNDSGGTGYTGPCPPPGKVHRYVFRLFALDVEPSLAAGFDRSAFEAALGGHLIAETRLVGRYGR